MKNLTRLGASLLGTWTGETHLSTTSHHGGDASLTAYFVAHFMPDPRQGRSCSLVDCEESDNHVCMMTTTTDNNDTKSNGEGPLQKVCRDIGEENDVPWSDRKYCGQYALIIALLILDFQADISCSSLTRSQSRHFFISVSKSTRSRPPRLSWI